MDIGEAFAHGLQGRLELVLSSVSDQFYRGAVATSAGEFAVTGEEWGIQGFGEGDVGSVVGGEGVTEVPDARNQGLMVVAFDDELREIAQGFFCAGDGDFLAMHQAAQNLCDFDVEELRCVHALGRCECSIHQAFGERGSQEDFEQRGGVENDQRLSRSALRTSVGLAFPG